VTLCDRWFGFFIEHLRVLGLLDNTMVIFTSDHGHSIGDFDYMGKRGYPSSREVFDIPLMIRFPGAEHAGATSDATVQHHDISGVILEAAGVEPPKPIDGKSFLDAALGGKPFRDHATVGWGSAVTVVTDRWWFNGKVDRTGALLYDLTVEQPFARSVVKENRQAALDLFALAERDAQGGIPEWLIDLARRQADAPGCSDLAARE
jgi:arylsulfatase A-like enzyme